MPLKLRFMFKSTYLLLNFLHYIHILLFTVIICGYCVQMKICSLLFYQFLGNDFLVYLVIVTIQNSLPYAMQLGDDEFGYMLVNILKQNNVNTCGVRYDPNARTALAFVTLRADGEREFLFFRHPSADMLLHESELDNNILKKVHFSLV